MKPNNFQKSLSLLLAVSVILFSTACASDNNTLEARDKFNEDLYGSVALQITDDESVANATTSHFTLAYAKKDTLNPYKCTSTLNATLCDLLYDRLLTVTGDYQAKLCIAQEIVQSPSSHRITVTLRSGIVFSDGTPVTAADVKYSFDAAKAAGSHYTSQLSEITACQVSDNKVYFRMATPNPMAYMLLDFPIIKSASDADGALPIGSGRYIYHSSSESGTYLSRNELWYSRNYSEIDRISLVSMPTVESIVHSIEIGTVSYFYTDMRDGYPSRINANYSMVDLNNIVYLGLNTNDSRLSDSNVRMAISLALDRDRIATSCYSGKAYAASGPFTSSWPEAAAVQFGSAMASPASAKASLSAAGYSYENDSYIRCNSDGRTVSFSLIVSADNEQRVSAAHTIAEQLREAGISVTVYEIGPEDLANRLQTGSYELYLGEYSVTSDMNISNLFTPGRGLYTGPAPENCIAAYDSYLNSASTLAEFIDAFQMDIPFIPIVYRMGMVCFSRALEANMDVSESDHFMYMYAWKFTAAGSEQENQEEVTNPTQ